MLLDFWNWIMSFFTGDDRTDLDEESTDEYQVEEQFSGCLPDDQDDRDYIFTEENKND